MKKKYDMQTKKGEHSIQQKGGEGVGGYGVSTSGSVQQLLKQTKLHNI